MNKQVIKNSFFVIIMTLLSVLFLWLGSNILIENSTRDINKTEKINGVIENVGIVKSSTKVGAVPSKNMKLKFLKINIENSNIPFFTYTPSQDYSSLLIELKKGSQITIYYRLLEDNQIQNNIFRLDNNSKTVIEHEDYKRKENFAGFVILFLGIFFLVYTGFVLKKKGLRKNWG